LCTLKSQDHVAIVNARMHDTFIDIRVVYFCILIVKQRAANSKGFTVSCRLLWQKPANGTFSSCM